MPALFDVQVHSWIQPVDWSDNELSRSRAHKSEDTTLAKKIVTAEKFMRLIDGPIMDIELRFDSDATHGIYVAARRELALHLQIEVDVARYHVIALRINLMNISAVTIFLARVVDFFDVQLLLLERFV